MEIIKDYPTFNPLYPVFCDIETQGLYTNPRTIQMYQPATHPDTIFIIDTAPMGYTQDQYTANLAKIKAYLLPLHTVWYNASYDLGTLNIVTKRIDDLFYAVKSAYPQFQQFKLDHVMTALGHNYYANLDKKDLQSKGFTLGAYLSHNQLKYAAIDVIVLNILWQQTEIQSIITSNKAYALDMQSLRNSLVYQQNGLLVDHKQRLVYLRDAEQRVEKYTALLPEGLNPNSYLQVRKYLNTDKSDHDSLVDYSISDRPLAKHAEYIMELKKAKKQVQYLNSINFERMYTKFNPAGAITGRFTSSGGDLVNGFNAQQIPRDFQGLFNADTDTTAVVHLDYSTLELRVACAVFGLSNMYKRFKAGEDIHTTQALRTSGKRYSPDLIKVWRADPEYVTAIDRQNAKAVNFGFVFGMGAEKFRSYAYTNYGVTFTLKQCQDIRADYYAQYPEAKAYHAKVWNAVNAGKYIYTTAMGRRVCPRTGTDGINGPVQGTGAETTKLAANMMIRDYPETINYIFNIVHDAIYMRVPKEDKDKYTAILEKYMLKGWEEISKLPMMKYKDIPMKVD